MVQQLAFGLSLLLVLNKSLHSNKLLPEVERLKSYNGNIHICVCGCEFAQFASCPSRVKIINSSREGAVSGSSSVSVHVCLTLSVTICFCCPPEADVGWDFTTRYSLLQVM